MPKKAEKEEELPIEEETTIKEKRGRKPKKTTFTEEELQEKFAKTFSSAAFLLKVDCQYKEKDFQQESRELLRLASKNPILSDILTFLDPIFLLMGLMAKVFEMVKKVKERKGKEQEEKARREANGGDSTTRIW
ncbi:MAG: hypothetical protein DDT41_01759 [candidate division WS2 bacterium]|nr:hypothetical protein [Candidatus Psychracetigena formicireducens]